MYDTVNTEYIEDFFHLPLSNEAYSDFEELEDLCIKKMRKFMLAIWIHGDTYGEMNLSLSRKHTRL
jgi:hypothetical protein